MVKACGAACPAGGRDRHRAGTGSGGRIEHEVGGQRRTAAHDDVGDRHAATADGHRRGADDEIGARQRDRHRGAPDALIRRDARQRRSARPGGRLIVKVCAPLVPAAVVTVTERGPVAAAGSSTKLAVSDVAAAHDDVVDRHAATADGHRRGADDEIGARQRDRHRGALDALIRRDAGQRRSARRRQADREDPRSAGPAGRRDRHRAGTLSCGRIEHEVGGQRRRAAHDDVGDRHAATADGHRRGADDEIGARQRDRHRGAPDALIRRDAGQRRRARRRQT